MSSPAMAEEVTEACLAALRLPRKADTLSALFRARVERFGDRPFLFYRDRVRSWRQTAADAAAWAHYLRQRAAPGERVAVVLPNCDSLVVLLLACAEAGLIFVPVNSALSQGETEAALRAVTPTLVVVAEPDRAKLAEAVSTIARDEGGYAPDLLAVDGATLALPDIPQPTAIDQSAELLPGDVRPEVPLAIVFTSGTTGVPKGAVHSNRTYVMAAEIAAFRMRLSEQDRVLVILPLFHLNALFYSVGGAIVSGALLIVEDRFHAAGFWRTVARFGITQVNMIAAVGNILLKRDRGEFPGNSTLRKVSAAPVTAEVATALREAFGITHVVESYGMTEAPGIAQVDFFDQEHRACLGRPIVHPLSGEPVSEIRIVDEALQELPAGQIGRIMIRAKTMMRGYFNRPDLQDRLQPNGWFLTEDRGRADEDGYFYFCGRTSDLIRTRGENVAAAEIEGVLLTHPAVNEAGCIGVPSELGEEDILAAVAPRAGATVDAEELAQYCRKRLSRHKVPRYFVLRAELPKTPTQKIAHHRLRAEPDVLAAAVEVRRPGHPESETPASKP